MRHIGSQDFDSIFYKAIQQGVCLKSAASFLRQLWHESEKPRPSIDYLFDRFRQLGGLLSPQDFRLRTEKHLLHNPSAKATDIANLFNGEEAAWLNQKINTYQWCWNQIQRFRKNQQRHNEARDAS